METEQGEQIENSPQKRGKGSERGGLNRGGRGLVITITKRMKLEATPLKAFFLQNPREKMKGDMQLQGEREGW